MDVRIKNFAVLFAVFFLSITTLAFSGLSVSKAISAQNDVMNLFVSSAATDILSAIIASIIYTLQMLLPLLPFLVFSAIGFFLILYLNADYKSLLAALVCVALLSFLVKPSLAILLAALGFLPSLLIKKTFEPRSTALKSVNAFVSSCLRWLNIFVVFGLFLAVYAIPNYEKIAEQQMLQSMSTFMPDLGKLQQYQTEQAKEFVDQAYTGLRLAGDAEYANLSLALQTECSPAKDAIYSGIESYKNAIISQLGGGGTEIGAEQLTEQVIKATPALSAVFKALPLLAAVSLFFLLELLKPFLVLLAGAAFLLLSRIKQ